MKPTVGEGYVGYMRKGGVLLAAMCLLLNASCSNAPPQEDGTIVVGMLPVADLVVLRAGADKGFFVREGLNIHFVDVPRGDASVSALLSGSVNAANVDVVTGLVAQGRGLPIKWVATAHSSPATKDVPFAGTFVRTDSGIHKWADLNGKRIGVSCINCGTELYIRGAIDRNGGDSSTLKLFVMPTAQSLQLLGRGDLDAVPVSPGLVRRAVAFGYRTIGDHIAETALGHQLGPIAVNTLWADKHPELVKAFIRGVEASTQFASAHKDEMRELMPKYYPQMVPDRRAANSVPIPVWSSCFRMETVRSIADFSFRYGFIDRPVTDINSLFYTRNGIMPRTCPAASEASTIDKAKERPNAH